MRKRRIAETMPDSLADGLRQLGSDISAARRARHMNQDDLAARMNVGRRTVIRMEAGDHRVSLGSFLSAAWIMGLEARILGAFSADHDAVQQREGHLSLPKRVDNPRPHARRARATSEPAEPDTGDEISANDQGLDF